jgi:hypothetical protein
MRSSVAVPIPGDPGARFVANPLVSSTHLKWQKQS